jgi:HlyD family secretion protein
MNLKQRVRIAIPILLVAAVTGYFVIRPGDDDALTASGTVEAREADLGFQTPGRIDSVVVDRGDVVTEGQTLARLDRTELEARRTAATAQLAVARAQLDEMRSGFRREEVAQGRAAVRAAERRTEDARRDVERTRRLFEGGAVSQQALDNQRSALELAEAALDQAMQQLEILETGPRSERIAAQEALVRQAEAAIAQLDAALAQTIVLAPFGGTVTIKHREPGEIVAAGTPVVTVMDPDDRWVRIYVREDALGRLSIGQDVSISADTYPDRRYGGRIIYISNEAEFTPRNVQTTEERVKLVYEVRVRITRDAQFELKPGTAADVHLPALAESNA